jgi:hypothetical protein
MLNLLRVINRVVEHLHGFGAQLIGLTATRRRSFCKQGLRIAHEIFEVGTNGVHISIVHGGSPVKG